MDGTVKAKVGNIEVIELDGKYRFREEGGTYWEREISTLGKSPEDALYEAKLHRNKEAADLIKSEPKPAKTRLPLKR